MPTDPSGALVEETLLAAIPSTEANGITADQVGVAAATGLRLIGFAARESAGTPAAATFILRHGAADSDPVLAPVELSADESTREWWWPGLDATDGIFIEVVAGTIDITLFHVAA